MCVFTEDAEVGPSPRKLPPGESEVSAALGDRTACWGSRLVLCVEGDSLHFEVSTMEELRLKRALKASMRRAGYPMLEENPSATKEKENMQAMFGAELTDPSDGNDPPPR